MSKLDDSKDMDLEVEKPVDQAQLLPAAGSGVSQKREFESILAGEEGLTTFTAILAMISTIIGGGIVGLPGSFLTFGIPLACVLNIATVFITVASGKLYLKIKAKVPDKPESLYEIGYMLVGRNSIFMIAAICVVNAFGLMLIYFIVFSDTAKQLVSNVSGAEIDAEFYTSRYFYVLSLAALLVPVVLMKELAELDWVGMTLFVAIGLFVIINAYQLLLDDAFPQAGYNVEFIKPDAGWGLISALSVTLVAYSYQQNLFPIYSSLKDKSDENYVKVSYGGLFISFGLYLAVALLSLFMFGEDLESSVLDNIG